MKITEKKMKGIFISAGVKFVPRAKKQANSFVPVGKIFTWLY